MEPVTEAAVMEDTSPTEGVTQQLKITNDEGETIYVQLPPDITLDSESSIVTTETTENGEQIVRILAVESEKAEQETELPHEEPSEQHIQIVQSGESSSSMETNQLQLFQQAMALLNQQEEGAVSTIITQDDTASGENTVFIVQQEGADMTDGSSQASLHQLAAETGVAAPAESTEVHVITAGHQPADDTSITTGTAIVEALGQQAVNVMKPPEGDPVSILPVKRGRGRPRKDRSVPPPKPRTPSPPVVEPVEESLETSHRGRPMRKAALKFLKSWEELKKTDPDADIQPDTAWVAPVKKPVGRPLLQTARANKENVAPKVSVPLQPSEDQPAVVNVMVKDKTALQVLSDIGIHMLYYCKRCTFFSRQLMETVGHIVECRDRTLTEMDRQKAADAALKSSLLANAALESIALSCKQKVETTAAAGTAANGAGSLVDEEEGIQIDEHNYAAEVHVLCSEAEPESGTKDLLPGEGGEGEGTEGEGGEDEAGVEEAELLAGAGLDPPLEVECHLCGEAMTFPDLPDHLRGAHGDLDGEEAARIIEAAEGSTCIPSGNQSGSLPEETVPGEETGNPPEVTTTAEVKVPGVNVAKTTGSNVKYRCIQHEILFHSQADLTKHYVEVHWGATKEKVAQVEAMKRENEEKKRKEREEKLKNAPPFKRRRGRPPKVLKTEDDSDNDDYAKDPDFKLYQNNRCPHCYKLFGSQIRLSNHIADNHSGDKLQPVQCTACSKNFRNKIQWRNHYRTVHEGKKRKQSLIKKKYTGRKKLFICELCGYTTPELIRLRNHKMSVHEGQYPYYCDICDYKTNEKADMRRHQHKHEGIKRYSCEVCSYRTDQRWLLVNHCQRQHGILLERHRRNTRGTFWSNQRQRQQENAAKGQAGSQEGTEQTVLVDNSMVAPYTQEIVIEPQPMGELIQDPQPLEMAPPKVERYFVPLVTQNADGTEEVAMYAINSETGMPAEQQQQPNVSVEALQDSVGQNSSEVVYINEDGTILDSEQAALMLLAVGPNSTPGSSAEVAAGAAQELVSIPAAPGESVEIAAGMGEAEQIIETSLNSDTIVASTVDVM